jgi:hypothetical protein
MDVRTIGRWRLGWGAIFLYECDKRSVGSALPLCFFMTGP